MPEQSAEAPRPRPQYGEYATPEEQRARIQSPSAGAPHPHPVLPHTAPSHMPPPTVPATTAAARPTRTADRVITFALLVYGLVTVLSAVPQLWDFTGFAQTWMRVAGIDATFTNTAQGDLWGRVAALVFIGGWLLTAVLSWLSVRARRLSWWIPLVGAIVTFIVATVCLTVPLLGDPAIVSHFAR
ncbi:hypothetical protein ITJ43_14170 [Microbacterium sp. VKM Ac-2870]|uniref:DUF6264 family protein n=1 Tax=Microbacterium sp. VKM Ac-2870 TaxID=2783825 RepID=UPI00188BF2F4|nr:DUF6264 family protein [Microbacterium sp. VKM Ac-2870]MBF4563276.1 hypothetical protein [Microbacterium sp. VKM Ac-2870]